jgi:urate oxidase
MGLLTDQLTHEEQAQVLRNFQNLIAMRNKDKLRVHELADIVQHSDIINLEILKQYEGAFNKETKDEMTKAFLDRIAGELEALMVYEPNCEYEDDMPVKNESMVVDDNA